MDVAYWFTAYWFTEPSWPCWLNVLGMARAASRRVRWKPAAAQVFMNWNLSKRGASVFAQIGEYPADASVPAPNVMGIQMPPMDSGLPHRGMLEDLAKNGKEDQAVWDQIFGYVG